MQKSADMRNECYKQEYLPSNWVSAIALQDVCTYQQIIATNFPAVLMWRRHDPCDLVLDPSRDPMT